MITTQLNHPVSEKFCFESCGGLSLTVPNQALSIREILRRSGVIDSGLPVYYDSDPSHDEVDPTIVSGFDLADVTAISEEIAQRRAMREAEFIAQCEEAEVKRKADEQKAKDEAEAKARAAETKP